MIQNKKSFIKSNRIYPMRTCQSVIYAKKALRNRRIPFDIVAPIDPFYSESNMAQLQKAKQQIKDGNIVVKTIEELEAMEFE